MQGYPERYLTGVHSLQHCLMRVGRCQVLDESFPGGSQLKTNESVLKGIDVCAAGLYCSSAALHDGLGLLLPLR